MPPLSAYIDLHCERVADGLFGEPLNTISNIGFLIVAFLLAQLARREKITQPNIWFLIALIGFIGVGSAVFHTTARMWAAAFMDNLPIAIWAITFLIMFCKHVLKLSWAATLLLFTIFIAENVIFKMLINKAPDGYVSLIPSVIFLLALSGLMYFDKNPSFRNFFIATLIAVIAVIFRAIDAPLCDAFPIGTHFLWHLLMAPFVYIVMKELIRRSSAAKLPKGSG